MSKNRGWIWAGLIILAGTNAVGTRVAWGKEGVRARMRAARETLTRGTFAVHAGGAYQNFTQKGAQQLTDPGGNWTVRASWGMDQPIGAEAAYLGSALPVDTPAMTKGSIVETGIEALVRFGLPLSFQQRRWVLTPYAAAGVGWSAYNLVNAPDINAARIRNDDAVFKMPFGFGLSAIYDRVSADARVMWRPAFGDDMFREANITDQEAGQNTFSIGGSLGYHF